MMKAKMFLPIAIIMLLLLPGCWDYIEYENMNLVSAIGIDLNKESQKITVTVQYMVSGKGGSSGGEENKSKTPQSRGTVQSATDISITDAVMRIQQITGKRLFYGYMEVMIISEDAAKYILKDIMELADRTPEIRTTAFIVVTSGKAEDAINKYDPNIAVPSGRNIYDLAKMSGDTGSAYAVSIQDFSEMLAVVGTEPVAPRVITYGKAVEKDQMENLDGESSGQIKSSEPKEGYHQVAGMAAFQGEKFAGWLDEKESLGWNWITNKKVSTYKTAPNDVSPQEMLIFRITRTKSNIKVQLNNASPVILIDVKVRAELRKYFSVDSYDVLTPEVIDHLENALADSIRLDVEAALQKGQKDLKTDIFGFGNVLYHHNPKLWHNEYEHNWVDIFPDVPVFLDVTARVTDTGTNFMEFFVK